jgi:hypothetical protein
MAEIETREVFLPARVLAACMPEWETASDEELSQAVGDAMEHAYWHWRWVAAVRSHKCRLVVIQGRDAQGKDMNPHYQLGDLFTLSQWHPERALIEAQALLAEAGDGLTFDLPVDAEMLEEWENLAEEFELDDENALEVLATAMVLMDEAHDHYVEELGEDFYVATRGAERDLRNLTADEAGQWSLSTVQVVDRGGSAVDTNIYLEPSRDPKKPVPVAYPPEVDEEAEGDA